MRAAFCTRPGPADTITVGELPDPVAGEGEVLVRVHASAVNYVDGTIRSGQFPTRLAEPMIIGRDLAGVRADTGDRVWSHSMGYDGRQGACAELVSVPADRLYPIPDGVGFAEVVALAHPAATAHLALITHAAVQPGETVFVAGANGAVGACLVQLAVRLGATVIAAARSDAARAYVSGLGAEQVLESPGDIVGLTSATPVDVFIDTTGTADLGMTVEQLAVGGRVVVLTRQGDDAASGSAGKTSGLPDDFYTRDVSVHGFAISRAGIADLAESARTVYRLLAGGVRAPIAVTLPLSSAAQAHRLLESGAVGTVSAVPGARGRLVIDCVR